MDMHNEIVLRMEKEEGRVYRLHMPAQCPLGEAHDVVFQMLLQVSKFAQDNIEKMKEAREKDSNEVGEESEQK